MRNYLDYLKQISHVDVEKLKEAEKSYGGSWKKRGGVGAFMMLARKWDRIENQVSKNDPQWDIFTLIEKDQREEGIIDDVRDLRRYLLLVEAEVMARRSMTMSDDEMELITEVCEIGC